MVTLDILVSLVGFMLRNRARRGAGCNPFLYLKASEDSNLGGSSPRSLRFFQRALRLENLTAEFTERSRRDRQENLEETASENDLSGFCHPLCHGV